MTRTTFRRLLYEGRPGRTAVWNEAQCDQSSTDLCVPTEDWIPRNEQNFDVFGAQMMNLDLRDVAHVPWRWPRSLKRFTDRLGNAQIYPEVCKKRSKVQKWGRNRSGETNEAPKTLRMHRTEAGDVPRTTEPMPLYYPTI